MCVVFFSLFGDFADFNSDLGASLASNLEGPPRFRIFTGHVLKILHSLLTYIRRLQALHARHLQNLFI